MEKHIVVKVGKSDYNKMLILPKFSAFNIILVKVIYLSIQIFYKIFLIDQLILLFIWNNKHSKIALEVVKKKRKKDGDLPCQILTNWKYIKPVESV